MSSLLLFRTKRLLVFIRPYLLILFLLLAIRKANGIPATSSFSLQAGYAERNTLSTWLHTKRTPSFRTTQPILKRVSTHCPCQFRIRATYHSPSFDLLLIPNARYSRSTQHKIEHRTRLQRIKLLETFQKLNRTALNAYRTDPFFHYHAIHIPFPISVTLLVRRSETGPTNPAVGLNPLNLRTLLTTPPVSQAHLIHVHLITSLRSARCPILLEQNPQNDTDSSSSSSSSPVDNADDPAKPRVVGGDTSGNDIAKSMVYFLIRSNDGNTKACSGTLVSRRTVITAAHCGIDSRSTAYLGGRQGYPSSGKRYSISHVHIPTLFNSLPENDFRRFYYDIAVVILSKDAPPDSNFMLVNVNRSLPLPASAVRVAGYGILAHDDVSSNMNSVLHHVDVPVVSEKTCKSLYAKQAVDIDYDFQVCAGYVGRGGCDSCQGDSGGPMFQYDKNGRPVLVGVVSIGVECANAQFPGVYVRISGHDDFLPAVGINRTRRTNPVYTNSDSPKFSSRTIIIVATASGLVALTLIITAIMILSRKRAQPRQTNS